MNAVSDAVAPGEPPRIYAAGRLRIALLHPTFWPEVSRGAERIARELADGLLEREHRVRLITSHPGAPMLSREDGLEILRVWRPPDGRLRRRWYEDHLTHAPLSYLALRAGSDQVADALAAPDAIAAARWARRSGGAAVFSYMGLPSRRFLVARRRRLDTMVAACREVDAVVALSQAVADGFWRELGVRAHVIAPGVDVARFTPGGARDACPTIFCNASFEVPAKRVGLLLRALPLVRKVRPDARLALFRPRSQALAASVLRDCPGVELIDRRPGPNDELLLASYRRAWVTALPSVGEAFGLVLTESLACGVPAVGTNAGAIPEVLDRDTVGRVFDGGERELAQALLEGLELAEDASTAQACRARALDFSTARTAAMYESLYRDLLARA